MVRRHNGLVFAAARGDAGDAVTAPPSDAPPSRLLVLEADQLAVIAACGQPMHAGQVATLARRLRDIAADVDATERMKVTAPDGWVMVPRMATREMKHAPFQFGGPICPQGLEGSDDVAVAAVLDRWHRMLAAAPKVTPSRLR
jgi:hypothetical protein